MTGFFHCLLCVGDEYVSQFYALTADLNSGKVLLPSEEFVQLFLWNTCTGLWSVRIENQARPLRFRMVALLSGEFANTLNKRFFRLLTHTDAAHSIYQFFLQSFF